MSLLTATGATKQDEEAMLFFLLLECLKQQINALDGMFKHNAKRWVKNLIQCGETTLQEIYKQLDQDGEHSLGEMYDYIYMQVRRSAEVETDNVEIFSSILKQLVESQAKAKAANVPLKKYLTENPFVV